MKFSTALTSLILIVPLFTGEALGAATGGKGGFKGGAGKGAGKGAGAGAGKGAAQNATAASGAAAANNTAAAAGAAAANNTAAAAGAAAANNTAAAAANSTAAAAANGTAVLANAGAANNGGGNLQTSTTLDPAVIAPGFAQNGLAGVGAEAGEVASLTSTNNFINFCATVNNKPITNGQQIKTGSCNPAPMGVIAATTNMPAAKFVSPVNGQDLGAPNKAFNIQMAINNLATGNFVNAQSNYYAAPQQVNAQGNIVGHTHFTVQAIPSFTSTAPLDSTVFAFFKGVNTAAVNGVVSAAVTAGLPAGSYRVCSINTDANHAPCLVAVAQHGSLDDCVYFSVGGNGGANAFAAGSGAAGAAANATGAGAAAANAAGAAGAGAAGNATGAAGAGAAAGNATGAAGAGAAAGNATGAAGAGAAANATSAAGAGKGAGKGAAQGGKAGAGGRKAGGRRVRLGARESRLGRDY